MSQDHYTNNQPGLEVADPPSATSPWGSTTEGSTAPEVAPFEYHNKDWNSPQVTGNPPYTSEKVLFGDTQQYPIPTNGPEQIPQQNRRRRRWRWIAVVTLAIFVVIGAVVGGVVGSAASRNSSKDSAADSTSTPGSASGTATATSSAPMQSATLQSIRSDSKLAVAGFRSNGDININLFYQDPNNNIRYSSYTSTGNWSSPRSISAGGILPGTAMAASTIMTNVPAQIESFFFNTSYLLSGQNFRTGYTPTSGLPDSINDASPPVTGATSSRMAAYWPFTVFQNDDGSLQKVEYTFASSQNVGWVNQTLSLSESAATGTGLAIIPQTATYPGPLTAGLLYRTVAGNLGGYWLAWNQTGDAWSMGTTTISIPETSAIAAFAVAQQLSNSVNFIYVLYQDSSDVIQYSSYNEESGWSTPKTQDALSGADKGTDITCLTEGIWYGVNTLSTAKDMSKCYFQSGGRVKEVIYDGANWSVVGFISMT